MPSIFCRWRLRNAAKRARLLRRIQVSRAGAHAGNACGPDGHFRLSRKEGSNSVRSASELAQFELHARHGITVYRSCPRKKRPSPPDAIHIVRGCGRFQHVRYHVIGAAKKLQGYIMDPPLKCGGCSSFQRYIFADQVTLIFANDVLRQDRQLRNRPSCECPYCWCRDGERDSCSKERGLPRGEKRSQFPEPSFTDFFRRTE